MKSITSFREEFAKKVGTLLKGGGNKELPSSFSTSSPARELEEQESQEQKRRKWLVFELKSKLLPLFFPFLSGGVEHRVSSLLELSVDSKKVEELLYTLVSEIQHQREATLTTILRTREKQGSPYDVDKAMLHRDAIENLWRYPKISVTPNFHLLFVHLSRFLEGV